MIAAAKAKPYVLEKDEKTGTLYLKRERHPLFVELPFLTAFILSMMLAFVSYWQYITYRTDIECRMNHIQRLEHQLMTLQNDNKQLKKIVTASTDLDYIQAMATDMGMVPATRDHIVYYVRSEHEYVAQRENIPFQVVQANLGLLNLWK